MALKAKLETDLHAAQKEGRQDAVDTLRFLLAQLQNREIERRSAERPRAESAADIRVPPPQRFSEPLSLRAEGKDNSGSGTPRADVVAELASQRDRVPFVPSGAAAESISVFRTSASGRSGLSGAGSTSGPGRPLSDEEVIDVLRKESKKRKEAIELYAKGGRADLKEKEERELALIATYLPQLLPKEEIRKVVEGIVARGASEFSAVIREAMKELKGKADGALVAEVIKEKLSNDRAGAA